MTDDVNETVAETVEEVAVEAEVAPEADVEVAEEVAEEVATEEVVADEEVAEKADSVSKSDEVLVDAVAEIKDTVTKAFSDLTAVVQAQAEQIAQLSKSIDSVKNEVTEAKGEFNEFGKRVDAVEADTAFRKSGDLGEIVQEAQSDKIEKSLWDGRFLKTADLFK
jgi:Ni,Fe-hydrogenase I large subunit